MMRKARFNMIEITMALVVIGIGVMSVFGLIPIGVKAHRDAVYHNYSADAADELLHLLARNLHVAAVDSDPNVWINLVAAIPDSSNIPNISSPWPAWPALPDPDPGPVKREFIKTEYTQVGTSNLWTHNTVGAAYRMQIQTAKPKRSDGTTPYITDFDAIIRVWKSPTKGWTYEGGAFVVKEDTSYEKRIQLNIELSWPATSTFNQRAKARYSLEVVKHE